MAGFSGMYASAESGKLSTGNVNGDESVNAIDASIILREYADASTGKPSTLTYEEKIAADVNSDGSVDAVDASKVLQYYSYIATGGVGSIEEMLSNNSSALVEPLVLSGNPEDIYITKKPEYITSETIDFYVDEGIELSGDITVKFESLLDLVETATGMEFNGKKYIGEAIDDDYSWLIESYFGDAFNCFSPDKTKLNIIVVGEEKDLPYCINGFVLLNPCDIDIDSREYTTAPHEMIHALHLTNGTYFSPVLTEGYACYMTGQLIEKYGYKYNNDYRWNYVGYGNIWTKENAEAEFLKEREDNWECYIYGYRLLTYLNEVYGDDIFIRLLENAEEYSGMNYGDDSLNYEGMSAKVLKETTCETVFEDFAMWIEANEYRFWPDKYEG